MGSPLLFNPHTYDPATLRRRDTAARHDRVFEHRGKKALIESSIERAWYGDFLQFAADEHLFATFLTPLAEGGGEPGKRWDTARNAALSDLHPKGEQFPVHPPVPPRRILRHEA